MDTPNEPTVIGRYQVLERIGRGAMGTVYRATDPVIGRTVAIKLLLVDDADLRARFLQEVRAAGTLTHQNIAAAYDFGDAGGHPYIVMEFVEGRSLADRLRDAVPMPWADKLKLIQQLCAALGYAHDRGVVHRDIKPANLMLDQRGDLKVVDFGIAKLGEGQLTRTGDVLGTLTYMAPEQLNGDAVDRRCDIFSVGVVIYEILSGRRAFHRDTTSRLVHAILHEQPEPLTHQLAHLDPEWDRIIDRALRKNPAERYQSLAELAADVARVGAKGEPATIATSAGTTRTFEAPRKTQIENAALDRPATTRWHSTVPALVVAFSLLVVGAITWFAATAFNKPVDHTATGQPPVAPVPAPPPPTTTVPAIATTTVAPTVAPTKPVATTTVKPTTSIAPTAFEQAKALLAGSPSPAQKAMAADLLKKACEANEAAACLQGGQLYHDDVVVKNLPVAAQLFQRGCDAGSLDACHLLGFEYARGQSVAKDEEKAFALEMKACEGGVPAACTNIGRAYQNGRGVTRNLTLARAMFEKACDAGGLVGCVDGGGMMMRGLGGPADPKRAVAWFQRACDAGTAPGCASLAVAYSRGDGVEKNERRAAELFQRACSGGVAAACNGATRLRGSSNVNDAGDAPSPPPTPTPGAGAPAPPPGKPLAPVRVGGDIKPPKQTKHVDPVYPPMAQSRGVQGNVIIEAVISPDGKVRNAKVLRSIPLLDRAALDAVHQWEFAPTIVNGVAVPVIADVVVSFKSQ